MDRLVPGPGGFQVGPPPFGGRGPMGQELKVVKQFDKDKDGRLNTEERKAARAWLAENSFGGRGFGGGRRRRPGYDGPERPGRALKPADVKIYKNQPLYDPTVLRTLFLQFENADWEQELAAFNNTDVDVPAAVTVDGKVYKDVGVHFRGMSSFMMVPEGSKRSLNLSFDFVDENQTLGGYRTLNLLNVNSDPTFVRAMLYSEIARAYIPAPKTNYMRVVINGESWGVYINAEQFNKDFLRDYFKTDKGARWKVPGSPGAAAAWSTGVTISAGYKRTYEIKTKDDPKAWADLIRMFKVLNETPPDKLEAALSPLLDIDGALKFLARGCGAREYRRVLDPRQRLQHLPGRERAVPRHPARHERSSDQRGRTRGRGPGGPPPDFARGFPPDGFGGRRPEHPPAAAARDGTPRGTRVWPRGRGTRARPAGRSERSEQTAPLETAGGAGAARPLSRLRSRNRRSAGWTGTSWVRSQKAIRPSSRTK